MLWFDGWDVVAAGSAWLHDASKSGVVCSIGSQLRCRIFFVVPRHRKIVDIDDPMPGGGGLVLGELGHGGRQVDTELAKLALEEGDDADAAVDGSRRRMSVGEERTRKR
ncbi:hypothetical protein BHM03_00046924 [Ensete ventricosum]|nr:hypothetical protein BHM03_00046924 [Ensete ventricosum]